MKLFHLFVGAICVASPALASDFMFSYNAELSQADAYSSTGQPLEGWCSLIQQDRANWHRFGKRDADDESDPFFDISERRAMIEGTCRADQDQFAEPGAQLRNGNRQFYLTIRVFGEGGQVTRIEFTDGF